MATTAGISVKSATTTLDASAGRTWLDGAVGRTTVERLAKDEYGLTIKATVNGKGHTIGWTVTD